MKTVDSYKLISKIIEPLPPRTREVLERRFGLFGREVETLESIGRSLKSMGREQGITRERVRQIEEDGLKTLRKPSIISSLRPSIKQIKDTFSFYGDVIEEKRLLREADKFGFRGTQGPAQALSLVLALGEEFKRYKETPQFYALWTTNENARKRAQKLVVDLVKKLENKGTLLPIKEILRIFQNRAKDLSDQALFSYLDISKEIGENIFGEWGLKKWPEVSPRGVKDKAYLVLKRSKTPLHYKMITELINEANFSSRFAHIQTVHNELIKDPRFVLVGRGTYGLSEWGYEPGTVRSILVDLLKKAKKPVEKEELIKEVLKRRFVKANTVALNLQNGECFKKVDGGRYTLV